MKQAKRMTKQRQAILDVLKSTACHPTADWIYEQVRKDLPEISLGTVYRNLQFLVQEQEIQELKYGSTFSRFDGNPRSHYHFVCNYCGKIMDLNMNVVDNLNQAAAKAAGGIVQYHRLEFYGKCRDCAKEIDKEINED